MSETHTPDDLLTSAIEAAALAGWMVKVLDGEEVSEFAESFEPVKRVAELIARNNGLEKGSAELFGALEQRNATIESDRATIAELLAACEDLSERLTYVLEADEHGPDLCDADEGFLTRRCENDGCLLHAVKNAAFAITKAKESR